MIECVTLCLSCGRTDLLSRSLDSYFTSMPEPTELIIYDDRISRLGQAKALDRLISLGLTTEAKWFILLEDDWIFDGLKDWFYNSIKILTKHPEVMIIGLSITEELRKYMKPVAELSGIKIIPHDPWRLSPAHGWWHGWISSPRVMRRKDIENLPKFSNYVAEEKYDQLVWEPLQRQGRKSIWLNHAYVSHIGYGRSLFPSGDKLQPEARTWQKAWK